MKFAMNMKILKKTIIILIKLLLLSNFIGGCLGDDGKTWYVEIVNELQYPIHAIVEFKRNYRHDLGIIQPEKIATASEFFMGTSSRNKKADVVIHRISIFTEDKIPLMVFRGSTMNNYVIFRENNTEEDILNHREHWMKFRLEVKEDYINIGLKEGLDFEEEIENDVE